MFLYKRNSIYNALISLLELRGKTIYFVFADADDVGVETIFRVIILEDYVTISLSHHFPTLNYDSDTVMFARSLDFFL